MSADSGNKNFKLSPVRLELSPRRQGCPLVARGYPQGVSGEPLGVRCYTLALGATLGR